MDTHITHFEAHRRLLFEVAYRMLGSVGDAQDMVQDAWLRWNQVELETIGNAKSWLITVVSRLCLDQIKAARVQREQYYGVWLPEPLVESVMSGNSITEMNESVSIALLLVLEKLTPEERVGLLLYEVFGYSYKEIAEILDKSEVNCRKWVSRARVRVRKERPRFSTTEAKHEELLKRFLEACRAGELEPLVALLSEGATLYSDGGGKASAVPRALCGAEKVAHFFIQIGRNYARKREMVETRFRAFNGAPGVLTYVEGTLVTALTLEVAEGRIQTIFAHRNPDKLSYFEPNE